MLKSIRNFFIIAYAILAIFVTICLLSYNEFKVSEFGDYTMVIIDTSELEPEFYEGDLVLVDRSEKIRVGEKVFFYNTYAKEINISVARITHEEKVTKTESTYTLEGDKALSSSYVIGPAKDVTRIEKVGTILGILESKWGFLFLIVFPSLIAFLYEIAEIFMEIKNKDDDD